jgi:protein-tyrosine phosphatase
MTEPALAPSGPVAAAAPMRVCFICTGNICRSPMAAWVFQHMVDDADLHDLITVDSAAIGAWHVGESADQRALSALQARGYSGVHVAKQVDPQLFADCALVVALDHGHLQELRRLAPDHDSIDRVVLLRSFDPALADREENDPDLDIADPYYGDTAGFERCLDDIEVACRGLLEEIQREVTLA